MHKKLLALLIVSFTFVACVLILVFATLRKTTTQPHLPIPTSIPDIYTSPIPTVSSSVRVLSSKPETGAVNVAVDIAAIRILFNSPQKPEQFKIFLGASNTKTSIGTNVTAEGNQLVIQPLMTLIPNTVFTLTVRSVAGNVLIYSLTFTTENVPIVDTFPSGFDTYTEQRDFQERPDIYLANKLPYGTVSFTMALEIPDSGSYIYHVKPKITDAQKVRADVLAWLHSINLTDTDIDSFDIRYE